MCDVLVYHHLQGEHPDAWIGPWQKESNGKWSPDWAKAMEPDWVSMRDGMGKVMLNYLPHRRTTETQEAKPVWRVGGSSTTGSERIVSFTGDVEGVTRHHNLASLYCPPRLPAHS